MDNTFVQPRVRLWRTRGAAALALAGAVLLSSGLVVMTGSAASAEPDKKPGKSQDADQGQDTCDKRGYTKGVNEDSSSGDQTYAWGTLSWGVHTITYTVDPGYSIDLCAKSGTDVKEFTGLTGSGSVTHDVQQSISHIGYILHEAPPPTVTAVAPGVTQSTQCETEGSYTIPATTGVQYKLNGADIASGTHPGPATGTITAVATGDYELTDPEFSFALNLAAAEDCSETPPGSTAVVPSVVQSAACGVQGTYTIPSTTGLQYQLNGANIAPGTHQGPATGTITAVATGNHVLSNPAFSFSLNVAAAQVCSTSTPTPTLPAVVAGTESAAPQPGQVKGTESSKPTKKPTKAAPPQVLGTEAAVPTAVDAGLGSLPAAAPAEGSLLGQLFTAAGAALLLAAGWMMTIGRRKVGAREA